MGFLIDDKKLKRAGLDYWHLLDVTYYDNMKELFSNNTGEYYYFTTKAKNIYSNKEYRGKTYIVFGREDAGLPEQLLFENQSSCVRVPMIFGARSLNLSNTVCLATYEVLRQWDFLDLETKGELTKFNWDSSE